MTRPTKDPADRRAQIIAFRVTADERTLIDRAARRKGITLTRFAREAALRSAVRVGR